MNRFSTRRYRVVPRDADDVIYGATDLVVPVIDDLPLFEMLGDRWPGVPVSWIMPPSGQWLGRPEHVAYEKPIVLDGSCGEAECCGVTARISLLSDTVIWDEFDSNGAPDPPAGLRFEFSRSHYETQLGRAAEIGVTEWRVTDDSAY